MRIFVVLLLMLSALTVVNAQNGPPARPSRGPQPGLGVPALPAGEINTLTGVSVHVMPLSFVTPFGRFRAGVQYKWSRWSALLDLETGSKATRVVVGTLTPRNYSFRGIRPEIRYDILPNLEHLYIGLELPVTDMRRRVSGRFTRTDGSRVVMEDALQERTRISAILKGGFQFAFWNRLMLDVYAGFGVARRSLRYSEAASVRIPEMELFEEWLGDRNGLTREGVSYVPELAAGFRVGYWFGRNK